MTSRAIRTLTGLALMIAASQASAQSMPYSMEYRWLTLFGDVEPALAELPRERLRSQGPLDAILNRAFVAFESDYRLTDAGYATPDFRAPDPAFGRPVALQRPRQARLSFRIRF